MNTEEFMPSFTSNCLIQKIELYNTTCFCVSVSEYVKVDLHELTISLGKKYALNEHCVYFPAENPEYCVM